MGNRATTPFTYNLKHGYKQFNNFFVEVNKELRGYRDINHALTANIRFLNFIRKVLKYGNVQILQRLVKDYHFNITQYKEYYIGSAKVITFDNSVPHNNWHGIMNLLIYAKQYDIFMWEFAISQYGATSNTRKMLSELITTLEHRQLRIHKSKKISNLVTFLSLKML